MKIVAQAGREDIAIVYIARMDSQNGREQGRLIEFVESVQPPLPRDEKWVLIISTLYGCPVGCSFCDAGNYFQGKLTKEDLLSQIDFLIQNRFGKREVPVKKFKIQFSRIGEPAFNENILDVLSLLPSLYDAPGLIPSISTIAPKGGEDFFEKLLEIKKNIYKRQFQLQFSIHTTDSKKRDVLIPVKKWDFKEIADYAERFYVLGDRKVTLNFALAENMPVKPEVLLDHFSPDRFIIKVTPVNPTFRAMKNKITSHIKTSFKEYEVIENLKSVGYEVILSIGEPLENDIGSNCGQYIMHYLKEKELHKNEAVDGYTYPLMDFEKKGPFLFT